jgi:hypothetical protein
VTPLRTVGHAPPSPDPSLLGVHLLAGVGSGLLLALGVAALSRRTSRSYLLVVLALGALVARTLVSALAIFGPLDLALDHFVEHARDSLVATFLFGAIYYARTSGAIAAEGSK